MAAVLAVTTVAALASTAPASAASASFTLDMIGGQGRVILGKSPDTPLVIATPSTIKGTVDDQTGAITGGSLSTPPIHFTQQITSPITADVGITATFSDTTPNSGTGQVDGLGNVSFSTSLNLALHIDVGGGLLTGDCTSAPIALDMVSTAPYDPELGEVTLTDPAFAIPAVAESPSCPLIIAGSINDQLSAPNNSITLGLVGALPLPPPPGEPSSTTLAADSTSVPMGHPVNLTATVAPEAATGTVTFVNGTTSLGIAALAADGTASFTTSALPVGTHSITARYSGDVDHRPSTSEALTLTVTAIPNVAANLPSHLRVGTAATEFTATIANPVSGGDQGGLRLDMLFGRVGSLTTLTAANFTLEYKDGASWVPVPLARRTTPAPADPTGTLAGSYGGLSGFPLAAGAVRQVTFRVAAAANAPQGVLAVQFKLSAVDAGGAIVTAFSTTTASVTIADAARRPTTTTINSSPANVRTGFAIVVRATVTRGGASPQPSIAGGHAQLLLDGQPVTLNQGLSGATPTAAVGNTGSVSLTLSPDLTRDLAPGTHTVAVRFLGDGTFAPSLSATATIMVHPQAATSYDCYITLIAIPMRLGARLDLYAPLPASVPAGTVLQVEDAELTLTLENSDWSGYGAGHVEDFYSEPSILEDVVKAASLTVEGSTVVHETLVRGTDTVSGPPETTFSARGLDLTIPIEGEPGDVVEVGLAHIGISGHSSGLGMGFDCRPFDGIASFGSVTVAGTTLSSLAVGVVEEGSVVSLSASMFPSSSQGMVEFFDGATSLGFAPVSAGVATLPTTALPQGRRSVSARYLGDLVNAPSSSEAVEVSVRDVILCRNQTGTESGSTVRATYLSLLGRCAEPSGFAFWRGRLDAGLSAEVFAGQIANTLEAHGRSVDDGYRLVLGRNADSAGRGFWAQRLNGGQRYDLLLGDLAASPEFWASSGSTNAGFVTRLYDRLLHRAPDSAGLAYWVGRLDAGVSRASVAASFVRLPEPSGQIVVDAYEAILDRAPSGAEKAPAVAAFQGSGHRWKVYAGLIGTTEFHDRAQGHPNS